MSKGVLRNFKKFTGKHLCQSLFFNKFAGLNFIKKETLAQVFSCDFFEISKSTFFTEHLWTTASVAFLNQWLFSIFPSKIYFSLNILTQRVMKCFKKNKKRKRKTTDTNHTPYQLNLTITQTINIFVTWKSLKFCRPHLWPSRCTKNEVYSHANYIIINIWSLQHK